MRNMTDKEICICALSGLMDIIARKWSLFVLNVLGNNGKLRFNEIIARLEGLSPTTLTETLDRFVSLGLLARASYQEIPPRVEYCLTKGHELRTAIQPLLIWAARKDPARGKDPGCPVFARTPASMLETGTLP
jgi:DNA-binding HxlR family transcriptional regulator